MRVYILRSRPNNSLICPQGAYWAAAFWFGTPATNMMKTFSAVVVVVVAVAVVAAAAAVAVAAVIVAVAVVVVIAVAVVHIVFSLSLCQAVSAWCDGVLDCRRPKGNTPQSPQRIISSAMKAIYF